MAEVITAAMLLAAAWIAVEYLLHQRKQELRRRQRAELHHITGARAWWGQR